MIVGLQGGRRSLFGADERQRFAARRELLATLEEASDDRQHIAYFLIGATLDIDDNHSRHDGTGRRTMAARKPALSDYEDRSQGP